MRNLLAPIVFILVAFFSSIFHHFFEKTKVMAPISRIQKKYLFFIQFWKIWVNVFLGIIETQFRLHSFFGENCSKLLFFTAVGNTFIISTKLFITICPYRLLQCQALYAKFFKIRSSTYRIFQTWIFVDLGCNTRKLLSILMIFHLIGILYRNTNMTFLKFWSLHFVRPLTK